MVSGGNMPEYTQEQLDKMIADAKVGLFTREEHERELQREVDRRVETGIQKGLETHAERIRREAEEKAKLTAEERARLEVAEKEKQIAEKEKEISRKANELEARDLLVSAGVPKEQYTKLLGVFGYPIEHTLSPVMQNALLQHLEINAVYLPFSFAPHTISDAITAFKTFGLIGANLTIPFKETVIDIS